MLAHSQTGRLRKRCQKNKFERFHCLLFLCRPLTSLSRLFAFPTLSLCLCFSLRRWSMGSPISPVLWPLTPSCNLWPSGQSQEPSKCILFIISDLMHLTEVSFVPPVAVRQATNCTNLLLIQVYWYGNFQSIPYNSELSELLSNKLKMYCDDVFFFYRSFRPARSHS